MSFDIRFKICTFEQMKKAILFSFIFLSASSFAQSAKETEVFKPFQDSILHLCRIIYNNKTKDAEKEKYNAEMINVLEQALNTANSFEYPFDSLSILRYISVLPSSDHKCRVITWNIPKADGTQQYYGFVQEKFQQITSKGLFKHKKTEVMQLYKLTDKSADIKNPDNTISDHTKWFGMLYYKIIENKWKGKTYYTLLAWDGNDKISSKKIIDVLSFDLNGTPHFGADIFVYQKKYPKRIIFEYSANCTMSLRYSTKKDSIVFDHLSPTSPQLEGQYQYYCNDMSYDGFGFKKGKWNYGMDLNAINDRDEKDKLYHRPDEGGASKKESTNYKTIFDEYAPAGEGNKVIKHERKKRNKK